MHPQGVTVARRSCSALVALLVALLAAVVSGGLLAPGTAAAAPHPGAPMPSATPARTPLLVVGFGGVTWDDVTTATMPRLTALASQGGTADLVVRTVHDTTCPLDGWLTLGAGSRATGPDTRCRAVPGPVRHTEERLAAPTDTRRGTTVTSLVVPGWADAAAATRDALSGARPGTLAPALRDACALGNGAAWALADSTGTVARWRGAPTPDAVRAALADCGTVVVDTGSLPAQPTPAQVRALDDRLGAVLDAARSAAPGANVVAASLADGPQRAALRPLVVRAPGYDGRTLTSPSTRQDGLVLLTDLAPTLARLRGATAPQAWTGDAVTAGPPGGATRRADAARDTALLARRSQDLAVPFFAGVAAVDALVLGALAALAASRRRTARRAQTAAEAPVDARGPRTTAAGTPQAPATSVIPRVTDDGPRTTGAAAPGPATDATRAAPSADAATAADPAGASVPGNSPAPDAGQPGSRTTPAGTLGRRARRAAAALAVAATVAAAVPAASFLARLVPWWRSSQPALVCAAITLAAACLLAVPAWLGPWRRHPLGPVSVVALLSALVIGGDAATGSHLMISSLMGEHPAVGGRFYGLGNAASGVFAACTLVVMTALVERGHEWRRTRALAGLALLVGLAAAAFTVAPGLGADFGGFAALVPAVAYLALRGLGMRLDAGRFLVLGILTLGLLVAACLLDWLRPAAQRSHLGRFAESVISGGGDDVVARKLVQNWHILTSSPATVAIPVVVLLLTLAVWRPARFPGRPLVALFDAVPMLRLGLLSVAIMLWIAFVLNDSGATVPVPVGFFLVPGVVSVAALARWVRRPDARSPRTGRRVVASGARVPGGH